MKATRRRIGPLGTGARILAGLVLLYLAGAADGGSWDVSWFDPVVGFVALPGVMVALGLAARHYTAGPVRFTGVRGHALNCVAIVALVANPYTAGGAILFYGSSMLIAAWRRQRGCESTVISNLILGRNDQIGCPLFWPVDEAEERLTRNRGTQGATSKAG